LEEGAEALAFMGSRESGEARARCGFAMGSLSAGIEQHLTACGRELVPYYACKTTDDFSQAECIRASRLLGACIGAHILRSNRNDDLHRVRAGTGAGGERWS
jgi:hypothetical protein